MRISDVQVISHKTIYDPRGNLSVLESVGNLPFTIKRIFYIWNNLRNHPRGGHAHKGLYQALIAIHGSCKLIVDDGHSRAEHVLNDAGKCIIVPPGIWGEQVEFSKDCVLLVIASEHYDESDYIRDYQEYLSYVNNN